MLKETNQFDVLVTHSTKFHADDVFSTALMKIINPKADIVRTLNPDDYIKDLNPNVSCIVYDIGRGKYDHHQKDAEVRENGIKYAAFGLLWRDFGDWEQYPDFDKDFIQKIDDHDNGGKPFDISVMIKSFNLTSNEKNSEYYINIDKDTAFNEAVGVAKKYLLRMFAIYDEENKANKYIHDNGLYLSKDKILILSRYCEYSKFVFKNIPECKVVIYPSERSGYNCQVVTKTPETMESLYTFPEELHGKSKEELPDGVIFVHNSGFLLVTETLDMAYKYAMTVKNKI